ncbi:hypothetical protein [Bifidobacterium dentium]|uniref:hypothetical protein n=1 Tax=Bifidobacterium dentium TaxID=1689 RepID=UPI0018B0672A|nr:hypothetical protein [Bifidobacterium dentium]MBF9694419.1 hypothetical protein [Bifidobacterium dentium]
MSMHVVIVAVVVIVVIACNVMVLSLCRAASIGDEIDRNLSASRHDHVTEEGDA